MCNTGDEDFVILLLFAVHASQHDLDDISRIFQELDAVFRVLGEVFAGHLYAEARLLLINVKMLHKGVGHKSRPVCTASCTRKFQAEGRYQYPMLEGSSSSLWLTS